MDPLTIVIILIILLVLFRSGKEAFALLPPYWNVPTRNTRRGSYDIRGDPPLGVSRNVGPWNISSDYYNYYPWGRQSTRGYGRYGRFGRYSRPYQSRWRYGLW